MVTIKQPRTEIQEVDWKMKKKKLTIDEFIKRVENKESVSRFEFEYDFEWDENNSERLRCVLEKIKEQILKG